ncbi:MAG: hypothetical protein ABUT39_26740 [Acidobacteriota bacterium]
MTRRSTVAVLALLVTGTLAPAARAQGHRPEFGTPAQQSKVRTRREVGLLPLQAKCNVDTSRELFITDLTVVEDCYRTGYLFSCAAPTLPATRGAWTFGKLMEGIFGTTDPQVLSDKTLQFLRELTIPHTINGETVAARPDAESKLVQGWLGVSSGGRLDMKQAPFQLNAIVARLDMRQNGNGTVTPTGGELHFVFQYNVSDHFPSQAFFIFEYNLNAANCADILAWAQRFHNLGGIAFGKNYNAALQTITDMVTKINGAPGRLNGSALNQVRSNELEFGPGWQQRQFMLSASASGPAALLQTAVPQTPQRALQNSTTLANYINSNAASILAGTYTVPLTFNGVPFLGGVAPNGLDLKWDGPSPACSSIVNKDARAAFSNNTCNGCHGPETGASFKQVLRRNPGMASLPSNFLKGVTVTDLCGIPRTYNDLERRRVDMCQLLSMTCSQVDAEPEVHFLH